jgi:hypothetical protein
VQAVIEAAAREQFFMRALLDDAPVLQHDDAIGVAHRGEAMRDDEPGAPGERFLQSGLDRALGEAVDASGAVVTGASRKG